ncbi:MAG: Hsp70 family protein [Prochlorothrix sp.]
MREGFLGREGAKALHLETEISRETFETLIRSLLEGTLTLIDQALEDAKLTADDLDRVILVGGSTRIPLVRQLVAEHLGQEPNATVQPDLCVALGAAMQAGMMTGAAVSAILVDVTPHSLGIATAQITPMGVNSNIFSTIIPRNTTIPTSQSELYSTMSPNQKVVEIEVFQGENPRANENVPLGTFTLEDLPSLPAGEVTVEVNFDFDINGILTVTATEKSQGQQKSLEVGGLETSRLSSAEIEQSRSRLDELFMSPKEMQEWIAQAGLEDAMAVDVADLEDADSAISPNAEAMEPLTLDVESEDS